MLDKDDCGKAKTCYSRPASCSSSQDCEYLLKYSVSGQDVMFELSSSKYQWIAVGFNPNKGSMAGGESLACETYGSKVVLRHYNMPKKERPDPSSETKATLLSSNMTGNILTCK
ncbi:Hypothetical predicted protein [Paramuricea clavata]|uniref:Uncharacterized protein n=1 Tax=Paramuricea clavata TaxID=317549 RepID=A0A7D9JL67_PARCT|nr:Hypothetical predicted protein [Paramuricea clavata]